MAPRVDNVSNTTPTYSIPTRSSPAEARGPAPEAPTSLPQSPTRAQLVPAWAETASDPTALDQAKTAGGVTAPGTVTRIGAPVAPRSIGAADADEPGAFSGRRGRRTGIDGDWRTADNDATKKPNLASDGPTAIQLPTPSGANNTTSTTSAAPVTSAPPIDLQRMEAINNKIQSFKDPKPNAPFPPADLDRVRADSKIATEALKKGDYKTAEAALGRMGFPIDEKNPQCLDAAYMLGAAKPDPKGGHHISFGPHGGNQGMNDLDGLAANAKMMNRMSAVSGAAISTPPTEAQATSHMKAVAKPNAQGQSPSAEVVLDEASTITNGSLMHYSSAGPNVPNPSYKSNPEPARHFFKDKQGNVHEFATKAEAGLAARKAGFNPAKERVLKYTDPRTPDRWSDLGTHGHQAGRNIGDCESKLYMQTRLLTEGGFSSIGSINVKDPSGQDGHMIGVFKAPDGRVFLTSNEDYEEVKPGTAGSAVTQADLDQAVEASIMKTYNRTNTMGFSVHAAKTDPSLGAKGPVDSIRRSSENAQLGKGDRLLP